MERQPRNFRLEASLEAIHFVQSGMMLGIGTGKTVGYFIDELGKKVENGEVSDILAVPTSIASANLLRSKNIPIVSLVDHPVLDLAIDGADEVDPQLNLIKGLGKALLREKVVEIHARELLILVDESKLVNKLGSSCPLPVEILPFEALSHVQWLNSLNCRAELWKETDGSTVVTDNGNYLARMWFQDGIADVYELNATLNRRPGILEHGLFLDMATRVIAATEEGIRIMERQRGS